MSTRTASNFPGSAPAEGNDTPVEYVPEELSSGAREPLPPRSVGFIAALLAYWLYPDRWGPHLAAGSRGKALIAYMFHFCVIATCVLALYLFRTEGEIQSLLELRRAIARLLLTLMMESKLTVVEQVAIILAPLTMLLVLILFSMLAAPWAAQGDAPSSAWARTLKSMMWSMSVFSLYDIVLVIGFWAASSLFHVDVRVDENADSFGGPSELLQNFLVPERFGVGLAGLLFLRAAWGGMRRYVGPSEGPGFRPRLPLCHTCAYPIVGLPMTGICPECEAPVQNSLPTDPLYSPTELRETLSVLHPLKYARFSRELVGNPEILKLLPVRDAGYGVRYWLVTYSFSVLIALLLAALLVVLPVETEPMVGLGLFVVVLFAMPVFQFFYVLIGTAIGSISYQIRDARLVVGVAGYASGHWWPYYLGMVFLVILLAITPVASFEFTMRRAVVDIRGIAIMGIVVTTLIFIPAMVARLRGGLRIARHSNIN